MNKLELAAGQFLAKALDGRRVACDIAGAPDGTHDFEIEVSDGPRIALEVTSSADEKVLSLLSAALKREWLGPGLANDWQIGIEHAAAPIDMRRLMAGAVPILSVFESHGCLDVDIRVSPQHRKPPTGTPQPVADAMQGLFDLGAILARSLGPRRDVEAKLFVSAHGGASSNHGRVNELVEAAAASNAAKLAAADVDERHLFVWLNASEADAELAISTLGPPPSPPALPPGVDVVWLATQAAPGHGSAGVGRLLRVRPPNGWETLDPSIAP